MCYTDLNMDEVTYGDDVTCANEEGCVHVHILYLHIWVSESPCELLLVVCSKLDNDVQCALL